MMSLAIEFSTLKDHSTTTLGKKIKEKKEQVIDSLLLFIDKRAVRDRTNRRASTDACKIHTLPWNLLG